MNETTPAGPATLVVEPRGDILAVHVDGALDASLQRECEQLLGELARATGLRNVLYDVRAMHVPEAELVLMQHGLEHELSDLQLRRAIVVADAHMAYMARIAFGEGGYRVFYDDIDQAVAWLRAVPAGGGAPAAEASVEIEGDVVVVRLRGRPDAGVLGSLHRQTLDQARAAGTRRILYDARALTPPDMELVLMQRTLDDELAAHGLRRAIVAPNTRIAYLSRLAFGEGASQVFYDDVDTALRWLRAEA